MAEVQIGFVSGLKAKYSVAENLLTSLYNVQAPISGIIEWDALEMGQHLSRFKMVFAAGNQPRNQSTLTNELMLDIMYKISGVNTNGGVCVYKAR